MTQACFKQLKTEMYQSQVDACKASLERLETLCPIEACACIRYGEDDLQTQIKFASDALSHAEEVLSQHKDTRLLSVVDQVQLRSNPLLVLLEYLLIMETRAVCRYVTESRTRKSSEQVRANASARMCSNSRALQKTRPF